jgi:peptide/nickel transport system substrate-binding protein
MQETFQQQRPLSRREFLIRAGVAGTGISAAVTLLAACGGDDENPTATTGAGETTPTVAGVAEPSATTAMDEPTATTGIAQPTEANEEPTPTEETAEPTPTGGMDEVSEIYGFPIEPAQHDGGALVWGTFYLLYPYYILGYDQGAVFEGLTSYHPETGESVAWLAEGWEASDDGTVWTFALRDGVTFHDGEPLRAEDVVFSIQLVNAAWGIHPIVDATFSTPDDRTVMLTFPETVANGPAELFTYRVRAKHVLADIDPATADESLLLTHPAATGEDPSRVLGTGPFRFLAVEPDVSETWGRYDGYWGGKPHLDELIVRPFATPDLMVPALQTGELDVAGMWWGGINPAQVAELDPDTINAVVFKSHHSITFTPNRKPDRPWFQDVRVRQALLYAIDREALIEPVTFGLGSINETVLTEDWAYNAADVINPYTYDPDQAAALLDEAGWVVGADGVREKDGVRLSFAVMYQKSPSYFEPAVLIVQEYWNAIGIETTLEGEILEASWERQQSGDFDLFVWEYNTRSNVLAYQYACDRLPANWGYCNPDLDQLIASANMELDPNRRREIITAVINLILEDVPAGHLINLPSVVGVSTTVHNVYPNPYEMNFNAHTWWIDA